jgi:Xaa-Pro aminopeptidase
MTRAIRTMLSSAAVVVVLLQPIAGQIAPYGGARELSADLSARRARTMAAIGDDAALVMGSAPARVYSHSVNYEYRQESNLLYLTGIEQEDTILVLVPGATAAREHIFVRDADPLRALWSGHTLTPAEVTARSGIVNVHPQRGTEAFDAFMASLLGGAATASSGLAGEFGAFTRARTAGRARLGILPRIDGAGDPHAAGSGAVEVAWARDMERRYPSVRAFSAGHLLTTQRQIKTPYEQVVLRRSVDISAEAHIEGMKAARPGRWEYEVEAAIEATYLRNGALSWGYPSIVGSGPNATVLHYLASTRRMADGDLLLVDAAANFQGLTGDITRTYPVNGRFSPEQRVLYDIVLGAQRAGIAAARPGGRVDDIVEAVRAALGQGLEKLGLVSAETGADREAEISLWFPHGPVHGIGVDVHDPLGPLDPGAAFVIEPGLYIRPDALDRLPKTPAGAARAARLAPLVERFKHIGIRIEDSFLMTPKGPVNMSVKAPKEIADLERLVGTGS